MILLVSGATKTAEKYKCDYLGQLLTPRTGNSIKRIVNNEMIWACDNACFSNFDSAAYVKMISKAQGQPRLKFVTIPDSVGDAAETNKLFKIWFPIFERYFNVPLAYVLQNGILINDIPWDNIEALFIGGTTEFKLGPEVAKIVEVAKSKDKWIHMGRVNTIKRIDYAESIGCDSIDGSSFSMYAETYIPKFIDYMNKKRGVVIG
jgi:hypothetical protein